MQEEQSLSRSNKEQAGTGAERRLYPRVPLSMKAVFRGGELEGMPCIIRDFCPGGFFLSWADEASGSEILAIKGSLPKEDFSVDFNVKLKSSGDKTYSLGFKVIRVFQGGMGVSFEDPDQSVIDLLAKVADATEKKKQARSEEKRASLRLGDQTTQFNKSLQGQLSIENNIDEILRSYFKKLDNKLIVLMQETQEESEKFEFFNAREIFTNDLGAARKEILQAVSAQLEEKPSLKWEKTHDDAVDGNSLALVDEKEFEAYLVLTGVISDAEANSRLLLFRVAKKLSEIFDIEWDDGMNPVGFSRLLRTIDSFLQYKQFSYTALKIAYQQMDEVIVPELIAFYEELAKGVEISSASKQEDSFSNEKESLASANLDDKVERQSSAGHGQDSGVGQASTNHGQGYQQQSDYQTGHQSGSDSAFPTLEGNSSPSSVTKGAGGLAQTLMALQNSVGVPDTLHEMFQGQADQGGSTPGVSGGMSGGGMSGGGMSGGGMSGTTIPASQQQNILQFLDKIQQEDNIKWQNGETIGDVTGRLNPMLFGAQEQVGGEAESALSMAGGVLNFLKKDQHLSDPARQDLQRMQAVLYKQAISEGGLFQQQSNPLRNIVNLMEQLDIKGGNSQPQTRQVLNDLVSKILSLENYDNNSLGTISDELNDLLDRQIDSFEQRVDVVAEECDLEQTMLKDLRKAEDKESLLRRPQQTDPTGEYKVWQDRAKSLTRGDSIVVDEANGEKKHLSLAWSNPDSSRFVFVDGEGNKAANMTQQELAVRLLKGTAAITDKDQKPLFDRAVVSSLFNAYDDVNQQIINDPETGLLNEEKYRTELNLILENAVRDHVEHAFFYLKSSIESNTETDKDSSVAYLKHISDQTKDVFGEQSLIGRLGENSLGITSEFMSREGALILAETLLKTLEDSPCELNGLTINHPVSLGITVINDRTTDIDEVIEQGFIASEKALEQGVNQAWLHEETVLEDEADENKQTDHESVDWLFWLEDHSQPEEVIPLFGQQIILNSDVGEKPLFHIFPAFENEEGSLRTPGRFINVSTDNDLIASFEKQYIKNCLEWMSENKKRLKANSRCLITLSGKTINSKGMLDYVIEQLTEKAVPPGKICFEVPGNPSESEKVNVTRFIRTLREFGCRFSLGQFGSDGLSQDALKLPVDYICIDENLTSDVVESAQSFGLIKSINDIAHMMDKQTIISQRVSDESMELLSEMNIDFISSPETEKPERLNPVSVENT